jgi:hypothetical protein
LSWRMNKAIRFRSSIFSETVGREPNERDLVSTPEGIATRAVPETISGA